jgi:hypothetical protein
MKLYQPQYQLWSDGEGKSRWIYIPECEKIDTSDMNDWQFPVGTRWFKEFRLNGVRVETRLIERIGKGPRDFAYASYQWNAEQSEATKVPEAGVENANGTGHTIPSKSQCLQCHGSYDRGGGRPSRGLGFSAIQLSHADAGFGVEALIAADKLSDPPETTYQIPGDAVTADALGYLHANCGNCHNNSRDKIPLVGLNLWLDVEATSVEQTGAWQTAVNQPTKFFHDQHTSGRIVGGNPEESAILYRMKQRGNNAQMPPVATKTADQEGILMVENWIRSLQ